MRINDIALNNKPILECELALECNGGNYRLYVDRFENGFYAKAVEFDTSIDGSWNCSEIEATELLNLAAYHDGVRHLEFNREAGDMAGYIYFPNIEGIILIFKKIREIEIEMCRDCDD